MSHTHDPDGTRIVVGYDRSEEATDAVRWAIGWAERQGLGVELLRVLRDSEAWSFDRSAALDAVRGDVEEITSGLNEAHPGVEVSCRVEWGEPAERLLEAGDRGDVVVVGSRGRGGLASAILGSVSAEIAVYNRGPVSIVVPAELKEYSPGPVVLGFDGSDESLVAAEFAVAQARTLGATLRVVSASSMPTMNRAEQLNPDLYLHAVERAQDTFEQSWRAWAEQHAEGVEWEFVGDVGAPARALADHSEDAGMIVVGSRGLGGFGRLLLGSTSRSLLFQATRAVAIVRPEKR